MLPEIAAFVREFGVSAAVIVLLAVGLVALGMALAKRMNTSSKQDELISMIAVNASDERKQLQEAANRTQAEYMELRVRVAKEEGKFEQFEKMMVLERAERKAERDEWKTERAAFDDKIHKMETRILELEKHQLQSQQRIQELEAEIELLNKRIAEADKEISILQAQKRELESQLERERNRADSLNALVTRLQAPTPSSDATIAIPEMQDVDITAITEPPQAVTQVTPETEVKEDDAA